MADSSGKLQIWESRAPTLLRSAPTPDADPAGSPTGERGLSVMTHPMEVAERLFAAETLSRRKGSQEGAEPFSLQWFLEIEALRYGRHGGWLPRFLEFTKHSGDRLLGLGAGLGTDWLQYARHGADVIACCSSTEQKTLVQRNFELRGLRGSFVLAPPTALPLESASIDVVCLGSLLQPEVDSTAVVEELYRVLKPGGKVLALARAYYDAEFWCYRWLPWRGWLLAPLADRPSPGLQGHPVAPALRPLRRTPVFQAPPAPLRFVSHVSLAAVALAGTLDGQVPCRQGVQTPQRRHVRSPRCLNTARRVDTSPERQRRGPAYPVAGAPGLCFPGVGTSPERQRRGPAYPVAGAPGLCFPGMGTSPERQRRGPAYPVAGAPGLCFPGVGTSPEPATGSGLSRRWRSGLVFPRRGHKPGAPATGSGLSRRWRSGSCVSPAWAQARSASDGVRRIPSLALRACVSEPGNGNVPAYPVRGATACRQLTSAAVPRTASWGRRSTRRSSFRDA